MTLSGPVFLFSAGWVRVAPSSVAISICSMMACARMSATSQVTRATVVRNSSAAGTPIMERGIDVTHASQNLDQPDGRIPRYLDDSNDPAASILLWWQGAISREPMQLLTETSSAVVITAEEN